MKREGQQGRNRTAEQTLTHARGLLNGCDLLELWKLSARLSLHESLTPLEDPLCAFPVLNAETVRMLSHAVLSSHASYRQGGRLPGEQDFRKIVNDCNHALYDPDEMKPLQAARGTQRAHLELQRILVRIGAVQIPGQEPLVWERAGRLIAMLEDLPQRYPDRIPAGQREEVQRVLPRVEEILGVRVSDLARAFRDVLAWQIFVQELSLAALGTHAPPRRASTETREELARRQARIMFSFLGPEPLLDDYLVFTVGRILDAKLPAYSALARPRVEAFMRLAARSVDELRAMLSRPEFRIGHVGKRLSPLERFPVVRVDDPAGGESCYVIPNYRDLAKSFNAVVDFALLEALGRDYEQARGALFHLYLRQLVEDRLPHFLVIPETRYDKARDSPDLTLVDPHAERIIPVEVKGRQINLATRLTLGDEELAENLHDAFKALRKLPSKVVDLRAGRPEFEQWRPAITATGDSPPILVAVLRDGLHLLTHLLREQVNLDPEHPLHGLAEPYCLLSADAFEKAIEVARWKGRSLAELLEDHYRRTALHDPIAPAADSFGEDLLPAPGTFASSFLKLTE